MALGPGSAAINGANTAKCQDAATVKNQDQRGAARITADSPLCDVGAYEVCGAKPNTPTLLSPTKNQTVTQSSVKLKWGTTTCAATYHVTVTSLATGLVVDEANDLDAPTYTTIALAAKQKYKWVVEACNTFGCTPSKSWKFKVQ